MRWNKVSGRPYNVAYCHSNSYNKFPTWFTLINNKFYRHKKISTSSLPFVLNYYLSKYSYDANDECKVMSVTKMVYWWCWRGNKISGRPHYRVCHHLNFSKFQTVLNNMLTWFPCHKHQKCVECVAHSFFSLVNRRMITFHSNRCNANSMHKSLVFRNILLFNLYIRNDIVKALNVLL